MSVAFRREGDEEHKEPKFELPLPPGPNLVTPRGLSAISARVAALQAELATEPAELRRTELERDLRYWRTRETTAQLAPAAAGDIVAIGTRVVIRQQGKTRTLEIVGHDEADASTGRVPFAAPLARALLGAEAGDVIEAEGGRGEIEIVSIAAVDYRA